MAKLTAIQQAVYEAYQQEREAGRPCGRVALAKVTGRTTDSVRKALKALRRMGSIDGYSPIATTGELLPPAQDLLTAQILSVLQKNKHTVSSVYDLADRLDISPKRVRQVVDKISENGYNVFTEKDHIGLSVNDVEPQSTVIPTDGKRIRFGALSDTHLCSKRERLDVLNALYDWYANEGITDVYHGGNWVEGEARFNLREIHTFGLDDQVKYFLNNYPSRPGITTRFISGDDHEAWWQQSTGLSIGRHAERMARDVGRTDLVYLGYIEHDVRFECNGNGFFMRIVHPGGGSAYALSYKPQKLIESYHGGEKPSVLLIGHFHKLEYLPSQRNVRSFQLGCTVDQSVWARKKSLDYHLGGWLIELVQDERTGACIGCKAEDRTFFDRGFYRAWED